MGLVATVQLILIVLKIANLIHVSWVIVFLPDILSISFLLVKTLIECIKDWKKKGEKNDQV